MKDRSTDEEPGETISFGQLGTNLRVSTHNLYIETLIPRRSVMLAHLK